MLFYRNITLAVRVILHAIDVLGGSEPSASRLACSPGHSIWDLQFGPPARAHRTLLLPSTQRNLPLDQAPAKVARSDGQYCASDEPGLPPRHRFLGHLTVPSQCSPDFAAAIGVLSVRHRQRPDPPQHLAKQVPVQTSLGQHQPVVPGVLDQPPASLHQPLLQACQRPCADSLRLHEAAPQVAQVVGQQAQWSARFIGPEPMTR